VTRLTSRPTPGRLVTRNPGNPVVYSHRAWVFQGQWLTHCGRHFPVGATNHRVFVRSVDLVPISCGRCLQRH
jgi:hypothetical protein